MLACRKLCILPFIKLSASSEWIQKTIFLAVRCGILVPQPGIEPMPSSLEARCLNHWTTREDILKDILKLFYSMTLCVTLNLHTKEIFRNLALPGKLKNQYNNWKEHTTVWESFLMFENLFCVSKVNKTMIRTDQNYLIWFMKSCGTSSWSETLGLSASPLFLKFQ